MATQRILQPPRGDRPHLTVPSLEEDANRGAEGFLIQIRSACALSGDKVVKITNMCIGSQDREVIHFECPLSASPRGFPVLGSHIRTFVDERVHIQTSLSGAPKLTWLSCPPVANLRSRASHSTHRTHPLWPESVCEGVSVNRSHKRALVSPEPVARRFPVGEKDAQSIGDE
jgi:hypothetical protein